MPIPERQSREFEPFFQGIGQRLRDNASIVGVTRGKLPLRIYSMLWDDNSQERFFSRMHIHLLNRKTGATQVTDEGVSMVLPGNLLADFAHDWSAQRETLVCDEKTAQ